MKTHECMGNLHSRGDFKPVFQVGYTSINNININN